MEPRDYLSLAVLFIVVGPVVLVACVVGCLAADVYCRVRGIQLYFPMED